MSLESSKKIGMNGTEALRKAKKRLTPPPNLMDSSHVEPNAGSLDSIQRNADFVRL
jgi:hypothetical protein